MKQCKLCAYYKKEYDEFMQQYDDKITSQTKEKHFCIMYDAEIKEEIIADLEECEMREAL